MDSMLADERVSIIVLIALATLLAVGLLEFLRSYFITRRMELRVADEALKRHFAALTRVVDDEDVSFQAKQFILTFSTAMSQRQIAMGIAQSIRFRKSPTLSEGRRKILEEVADEVRALMLKKKDLAVSMIDVVNFGFTAMVLRWPKTQVTLARALFLEAEVQDNNNNFRTKAACVLAQMPEKSDHNEDKKIMAPA